MRRQIGIQAPDDARRLTVRPSEIRTGDWMRDLGRLRQIQSIDPVEDSVVPSTLYTIRFTDDEGACPTLGVRETVPVTIWRESQYAARPPCQASDSAHEAQ